MSVYVLKNTLSRGEITPLAHARDDIELYKHGAASLQNLIVIREGGVTRRSGTRYRGSVKYADRDTRFLDYSFSVSQSYAIEIGDLYARFWTNGGVILFGAAPYEIVSPYAVGAIRDLNWVATGDTIYIACKSKTIPPKKLVRTSHTSWAFQDVSFYDGPYYPINDQNNTVTTSAAPVTDATSTLTFSNLRNINRGTGFQATDVNRLIRVQFDGKWSWGAIQSVSTTKIVVVRWEDGQGGTTASKSWRLGAFSGTTGYPGKVVIWQGRVFWASTADDPNFIGYSRSDLPEMFSPSDVSGVVTDSHGGGITLLSGEEILWMQEAARLQIGTPSNIRSLGATNIDAAFSPRNVSQRVEISDGTSAIQPVVVGASTVHTSRFGKQLRDLYFDYQVNSLVNPDLSPISDHLFKRGIVECTFQKQPMRLLWSVLTDGTLTATTIDRYEKVVGFTRHSVDGKVISAKAIPSVTGYDLYLIVQRTISGSQVQYVETLDDPFDGDLQTPSDAFFVDCGGTYTGILTNTVSNVTWLRNERVDILADGAVMPSVVVSNGGLITLPNGKKATKIQFGRHIDARGKPLPIPQTLSDGSGRGRKVRVVSVIADVYQTRGLRFVSNTGNDDYLSFRSPGELMGQPSSLFTGTKEIALDGGWGSNGQFDFVCDDPLPATIRAFNVHLETEP